MSIESTKEDIKIQRITAQEEHRKWIELRKETFERAKTEVRESLQQMSKIAPIEKMCVYIIRDLEQWGGNEWCGHTLDVAAHSHCFADALLKLDKAIAEKDKDHYSILNDFIDWSIDSLDENNPPYTATAIIDNMITTLTDYKEQSLVVIKLPLV